VAKAQRPSRDTLMCG